MLANDGIATRIRGVLLDLGGVVYVGSTPLEGALLAIDRLRSAGIPLRFVTNTTRRSRRRVIADLRQMGLDVSEGELLTPALLAREFLERYSLSPFLVVHPNLEEDLAGMPSGLKEAVVVGDAGEHFTYDRLNRAFRKLVGGAPLLALAMNRNFKDADGCLSLDAGPFVAALEYASGAKAVLFGKPSQQFYKLAVEGLGCEPGDIAMIGDDIESDVVGAMAAGLKGVLVRTGKYRAGDETRIATMPDHVANSLAEAVAWIVRQNGS